MESPPDAFQKQTAEPSSAVSIRGAWGGGEDVLCPGLFDPPLMIYCYVSNHPPNNGLKTVTVRYLTHESGADWEQPASSGWLFPGKCLETLWVVTTGEALLACSQQSPGRRRASCDTQGRARREGLSALRLRNPPAGQFSFEVSRTVAIRWPWDWGHPVASSLCICAWAGKPQATEDWSSWCASGLSPFLSLSVVIRCGFPTEQP